MHIESNDKSNDVPIILMACSHLNLVKPVDRPLTTFARSRQTSADLGPHRHREPDTPIRPQSTMNEGGSYYIAHSPPIEGFSYGGTSQYTAGGPSACGLASVNAALLVLSLFRDTSSTQGALDTIRSEEFIAVSPRTHLRFEINKSSLKNRKL